MTAIKKILEVEENAEETVVQAHSEARTIIDTAQSSAADARIEFQKELEASREEKAESQKKELATLYKSIVDKGHKAIGRLESDAGSHHDKAVTQVISSISN